MITISLEAKWPSIYFDFVLFLVDTEVLTLVAGVGLEVEQLFSVGDRCSEV